MTHNWRTIFVVGDDALGKSLDIIAQCVHCWTVKHDYRYGGGQTSPLFPMYHQGSRPATLTEPGCLTDVPAANCRAAATTAPSPARVVCVRTAAECAIYAAKQAVEIAGASELLTEATVLLSQAQEKVADHVDSLVGAPK